MWAGATVAPDIKACPCPLKKKLGHTQLTVFLLCLHSHILHTLTYYMMRLLNVPMTLCVKGKAPLLL